MKLWLLFLLLAGTAYADYYPCAPGQNGFLDASSNFSCVTLPTPTPYPTATARPTDTPQPAPTSRPTDTPQPAPTLVPTATPRATDTPIPTATPFMTPTPSLYAVGSLPTCNAAAKGLRVFVNDATACVFNVAPSATGSTVCPVFCDGSTWLGG